MMSFSAAFPGSESRPLCSYSLALMTHVSFYQQLTS